MGVVVVSVGRRVVVSVPNVSCYFAACAIVYFAQVRRLPALCDVQYVSQSVTVLSIILAVCLCMYISQAGWLAFWLAD